MEISHYQARRQKVFDQMMDNSVALLAAAPIQYRNSDTEFPYRQDSYFHYLTGFDESAAIAAFIKKQGKQKFVLFCQERDKQAEQWTGARAGVRGACDIYGADEAYVISEAMVRFSDFFQDISSIYYLVRANPAFDKKITSWLNALRKKARKGVSVPHQFIDLRVILDEMRLHKTPDEIADLTKACDISTTAHIKAMQHCRVGMKEYELEAILLQEFYRHGSRSPAYPCIVAGGKNACVLHYTNNHCTLKDNELVLIDAGAEYQSYAADITRTFPVNGKFSSEQKEIYELVLASQMAAIALIAPNVSWDLIQKTILNVLVTGLVELKILKGSPEQLIEEKAYLPFYMHNSGHWLGMDVHDVGDYKVAGEWRKLAKGMAFTIEPGLYIAEDEPNIPEKWRGIGVRIEDDIVVTERGAIVLTAAVPKSVSEVEEIMYKNA